MTQKELMRQEIERRLQRENEIFWNAKKRGTYPSPSCEYNLLTLTSLRDFIDSLPEEKLSYVTDSPGDPGNPGEPGISDLDKAALEYIQGALCDLDDGPTVGLAKETFIAGAEWQKSRFTVEDIKTILDLSFWNDDPEKILQEYNRLKK